MIRRDRGTEWWRRTWLTCPKRHSSDGDTQRREGEKLLIPSDCQGEGHHQNDFKRLTKKKKYQSISTKQILVFIYHKTQTSWLCHSMCSSLHRLPSCLCWTVDNMLKPVPASFVCDRVRLSLAGSGWLEGGTTATWTHFRAPVFPLHIARSTRLSEEPSSI